MVKNLIVVLLQGEEEEVMLIFRVFDDEL